MSVVERWARENGVTLPDQHAHRVDVEFFRTWSPQMAYILGFIAADGCVMRPSSTRGFLEIGLSSRDRDLLAAIRREMRVERQLVDRTTRSGHERSTLAVGSIRLVDDLIELGIGPRKSASLAWPASVPREHESAFALGYFDGDGSIDVPRTNNHGHRYERLRIRLTGTYEFLESLADVAWGHVGWLGNLSQDRRSPNVWTLTYLGSSAEAFGAWMYERVVPGLHLSRKRVVFDDYMDTPRLREHKKGRVTFDDAEAIRAAWNTGEYTPARLAEQYGVTASNISVIVRGKSFVKRCMVRS